MFCPKCGKSNSDDLKYCRGCGIGLEKVSNILYTELLKLESENKFFNERLFRRLGFGFLFAFLGVGFGFVFSLAVYYKFMLFGAEMMAYFGVFGFFLLGILSLVFFGVQKYLRDHPAELTSDAETSKLEGQMPGLEAGSIESARSVTENTTELLDARIKR